MLCQFAAFEMQTNFEVGFMRLDLANLESNAKKMPPQKTDRVAFMADGTFHLNKAVSKDVLSIENLGTCSALILARKDNFCFLLGLAISGAVTLVCSLC